MDEVSKKLEQCCGDIILPQKCNLCKRRFSRRKSSIIVPPKSTKVLSVIT